MFKNTVKFIKEDSLFLQLGVLIFVVSFQIISPLKVEASFYSIDPSYMDPTDLASGGASLTFATNEGMVFSNPALLAISPQVFRWLGTRFSLMPTAGTLAATSGGLPEFDADNLSDSISSFANLDLGVGTASTLLTFIMSNFAIVPVGADLKIAFGLDEYGSLESGTASLEAFVDLESRSGLALAFAGMPTSWWSLGVTARGFLVTEQKITVPLNISAIAVDPEAAANSLNDTISSAADSLGTKQVVGYDVGSVLFFQGQNIDYRIATVVRDVGGATITQGAVPGFTESIEVDTEFVKPQAIDIGVGITLHTSSSFIHFAADVRDYENVYGEPDFKRYAFGVKSHLARWVAIGGGIRHGYPTYGFEVDLLLLRLSISNYFDVVGDDPLGKKRNFYNVSMAFGTDF